MADEKDIQVVEMVTAGQQSDQAEDSKWEFDVDMTIGEMDEMLDTINDMSANSRYRQTYPYLMKIVKRWPYAGDPGQESDWKALKREQYREVLKRMMAEFRKA